VLADLTSYGHATLSTMTENERLLRPDTPGVLIVVAGNGHLLEYEDMIATASWTPLPSLPAWINRTRLSSLCDPAPPSNLVLVNIVPNTAVYHCCVLPAWNGNEDSFVDVYRKMENLHALTRSSDGALRKLSRAAMSASQLEDSHGCVSLKMAASGKGLLSRYQFGEPIKFLSVSRIVTEERQRAPTVWRLLSTYDINTHFVVGSNTSVGWVAFEIPLNG
jgi:hypothetical protein